MQPRIVGARNVDCPGRVLNQAERESGGGIDDRGFNAAFIQKRNPRIAVRIVAQTRRAEIRKSSPSVERWKRRKRIRPTFVFAGTAIIPSQVLQDFFAAFGDMAVTIDYGIAILSHNSIAPLGARTKRGSRAAIYPFSPGGCQDV